MADCVRTYALESLLFFLEPTAIPSSVGCSSTFPRLTELRACVRRLARIAAGFLRSSRAQRNFYPQTSLISAIKIIATRPKPPPKCSGKKQENFRRQIPPITIN